MPIAVLLVALLGIGAPAAAASEPATAAAAPLAASSAPVSQVEPAKPPPPAWTEWFAFYFFNAPWSICLGAAVGLCPISLLALGVALAEVARTQTSPLIGLGGQAASTVGLLSLGLATGTAAAGGALFERVMQWSNGDSALFGAIPGVAVGVLGTALTLVALAYPLADPRVGSKQLRDLTIAALACGLSAGPLVVVGTRVTADAWDQEAPGSRARFAHGLGR